MDGATAIHAAENEAYELALLDLGLPMTDGRDVLRHLRALGPAQNVQLSNSTK
jgi:two-component system OmpR family response regulator